jgi:membrane protease subunit HflC
MKYSIPLLILALLTVVVAGGSFFVVQETEQVIITQFGKPVQEPITAPGLHFKIPLIQDANYFPKNILEWDGDSSQIPTLDKTYIKVDTFARWRIVDPLIFFKKVNNETAAQIQLDSIVNAETKNLIQSLPLIETVRTSVREMEIIAADAEEKLQPIALKIEVGREQMTRMIMEKAEPKVAKLGIELIDLGIKRLNYIQDVQRKVFERMIAERKQIAEKFRSEGQGESREIEGRMEKDLKAIQAGAYRTSQEVKGKADAEAAFIYAEAYGKDVEFYSLVKTLDIYRNLPPKEIELILTTDSELFKYIQGSNP